MSAATTATQQRMLRFEIADREELERLLSEPLPPGIEQTRRDLDFFRDIYFEVDEDELARKGASVRLRVRRDGTRMLTVDVREREGEDGVLVRRRSEAEVEEPAPHRIFVGDSEPARMLRGLIDPARLHAAFEVETLRRTRFARLDEAPDDEFEIRYDALTVRKDEIAGDLQQMEVRLHDLPQPWLTRLVRALEERYGLRPTVASKERRAREVLETVGVDALEHAVRMSRRLGVVAYDAGRIALTLQGSVLQLPGGYGTGPEACRRVMRSAFGRGDGRIRLLGTSPGMGAHPAVEVWLAEGVRPLGEGAGLMWLPLDETLRMVGTPALRDPTTLSALQVVSRSELPATPAQLSLAERGGHTDRPALSAASPWEEMADLIETSLPSKKEVPPEQLLNMELSRISFDERVLMLAADPKVPLLERVRFLSIFGTRQDDFFMTRVAGFKNQLDAGSTKRTLDGLTPGEQLAIIGIHARRAASRAYDILEHDILPELTRNGIEVVTWEALTQEEREFLAENHSDRIDALLTPLAADPSHPFPHVRNLRPAIAVIVRLPGSSGEHFAAIELPGEIPRFIALPGGRRFIPLEEVILGRLPSLYSGFEVLQAHAFRVTRNANISLESEESTDVLHAVEQEVTQRPFRHVVRLEVESDMPTSMRDVLLHELQYEAEGERFTLGEDDIYPADWLVDLAALVEIAGVKAPDLHYPPLERRKPLEDSPIFSQLTEGPRFVHFPYDSFEDSVVKLLEDAASDESVVSVKTTVYRTDATSPIISALRRAREHGKEVVVLVELKASFDERRNIEWARSLESSGIHVVFTPPRYKVHAKVALVTRREGEGVARYAYIGTGNLNAATAAAYVDVGMLTADEPLTEELNGLFNLLTGYSGRTKYEHLIVAPFTMHQRLIQLIERQAAKARAGERGVIRAQMNGLSDRRIIGALYRASAAGVDIDLAVREICSLRPGVPGLSENIRVVSLLGRFLQHARIMQFGEGDDAEYFIGSADWRPRNLVRRVELAAPVTDPGHRSRLHRILDDVLGSEDAWELQPDGSWKRDDEVVGALAPYLRP